MDNWREIIYVNEEQQKVGEREAQGAKGSPPQCPGWGGGSGLAPPGNRRLGMLGGLGAATGPQGS